jgi:hypothetical protein
MPPRRLWVVGVLLVGAGWLVTPVPVPVYDGVGVPDEPYRFVQPPPGKAPTADPTVATATTPVSKGISVNGLIVATAEQTPQLSLFVPPKALAAKAGPITVRATPRAPADAPRGMKIVGNVYEITLTSPGGPVTTTNDIGIASLYLRALDGSDGWVMQHRAQHTAPWTALKTDRGGTDSHVSSFKGAGEYALAKAANAPKAASGGVPLLAWLLGGGVALLTVLILAIRLRAAPE